jgi:PAS domain S-box-containing protein
MHAMLEDDANDGLRLQLRLQTLIKKAVTSRASSLESLLEPCAQALFTALHAEALGIWTVEHGAVELTLRAGSGGEDGTAPVARVAVGRAHLSALGSAAQPAVFRDPRFEEPLFTPPLSGPERRVTVVPLVLDGDRVVGLLALIRATPLSAAEEEAFASVADLVSVAIEKQRATDSLREREDGIGTLIRTAPDGMVMMDVHSRIIATNPSLDRIFGYEAGELIGEDVTALMPERMRGRHNAGIRRYRETGQKRIPWTGVELVGLRKDGTEIPIEISFGEYAHDGRTVFTGFIRDIGERKQAEARDRRRRRVIQTAAVYVGSTLVALQAADLLLPVLPLPAWTFRALVLLAFVGLPVAGAVAWGYELAGIASRARREPAAAERRETRQTATRSTRFARSARPVAAIAMLILLALAGGSIVVSRPFRDGAARATASIAVLPFDDLAGGPQEMQLARGLTEDIVTTLSGNPAFRVASSTSVLAHAGSGRTLSAMARELGVGYTLEGAVRRSGERIRITVRLTRAGHDRQLWAATYDRDLDDGFGVQSEVALAIATAIEAQLAAGAR